jgi:iron complex transport system substrate-binding protein
MAASVSSARAVQLAATALTATVAVTSCGTTTSTAAAPSGSDFPLVVSSCGRNVRFEHAPKRVITAGSATAPLIAAAGAGDRVITRTFETTPFPGEYAGDLAHAERINLTAELALEAIIARNPDLVVSFEGAAIKADDLASLGIPLLIIRGYCRAAAGSYDDIFSDILLYGKLFGTSVQAGETVNALRRRVAAVADAHRLDGKTRRAAALVLSSDGSTLNAHGNVSTVHTQMGILGLHNIFGDVATRSFEANPEILIARDPELIIVLTQANQTPDSVRAALRDRPGLASLTAVRDDHIIAIPWGYSGPGPVAVQGLEVLSDRLAALR